MRTLDLVMILAVSAYLACSAALTAQVMPKLPTLPPLRPAQQTQNGAPPASQQGEPAVGGVGIGFQADQNGNFVMAQLAPGGPAAKAKVPTGSILRAMWTGQRAPQWLRAGQQMVYRGTYANSLSEGLLAPWRYDVLLAVDRKVGDCATARLKTQLDYGNGQPQVSEGARCYGPGSFANLYLDPAAVRQLQPGQVFDRDPITNWQLSFVGGDGRYATILEQGPLEQQSFTYDLRDGMLVATTSQQQQGPAVLRIELQLQR